MTRRPDHRSEAAQAWRPWYKTARWQAIRSHQLASEPLCRMCKERGIIKAATVCDHVDPKSKATYQGFHSGPFQSLCKPCHDGDKQEAESKGFSTRVGADGWPVSPDHPANR